MLDEKIIEIKKMLVKADSNIKLKDYETFYAGENLNKKVAGPMLINRLKRLAELQEKLYAHNKHSVLIIFQAMDAAGKDSTVKHVMSGFNPLGVKVYNFKTPTSHELDHDFLWRHTLALPARGEIAIHNRSHYENVLVTRVHPEYIFNENIPGYDSIEKIDKQFWADRYKQINRFEKNIAANGTLILKFFLNVSKKEQRKRFIERIDDQSKNWKFAIGDLKERGHWNEYQQYYEEAINATSKDHAPWYIIPADDKWFTRLAIAAVIAQHFSKLDLSYPTLNETQISDLQKARLMLMNEDESEGDKI